MTNRKQENVFEESWDEPSDCEMFEIYADMEITPEQLPDLDLRRRYAKYLSRFKEQGNN
jgi:hypothetical protein